MWILFYPFFSSSVLERLYSSEENHFTWLVCTIYIAGYLISYSLMNSQEHQVLLYSTQLSEHSNVNSLQLLQVYSMPKKHKSDNGLGNDNIKPVWTNTDNSVMQLLIS